MTSLIFCPSAVVYFKFILPFFTVLMEYFPIWTNIISVELFVEISNKIVPLLGQVHILFLLSVFRCSKLFRNASCSSVFLSSTACPILYFAKLNNSIGRQKNIMYVFIFVERVKAGREATSAIP